MFAIGDYVLNQKTGHLGKVVGYGHQINNSVSIVTLKVLVAESANSQKREYVVEDRISAWNRWSVA
ncbi:hypothetical protein I8752_16555 [Nostocaceae cyanobacterium CENA369]|jgi:hypothetical protein|uniref:Uncharacterized protein n=1 Tax=Dendronalium phyllosphericum CENA369 TaxID=1725256 RepID=A0A8J7I268_9NOST|nr:hypothetical protein [Dendronalium phyllosphericum]MBH8574604.1 hypothetical protein [Dendronalium phyllosphericum CENA369]